MPRRQRLGGRDELGEAAGETMRWRWMQVESKTGVEAEARAAGAASRESGGGCRERRRKGREREDGSEWGGRVCGLDWGGVFSKNVMRAFFCKNDKSSRFFSSSR